MVEPIRQSRIPLLTNTCLRHTYHMFDTLIQIIDHYGLEEEMNRAATVFACSDFSVKALLKKRSDQLADEHGDEGWTYTLDSLYRDFTAD